MSDIALYFPYINFPDDSWVKTAALVEAKSSAVQARAVTARGSVG